MNIFKTFGNALNGRAYNPEDGFDSFMFCRYLSHSPQTIQYAQALNLYYNQLDDESQYEFIRALRTPGYIKWIKNDSEKSEDSEIAELVKKYKISKTKAKDYLECIKNNSNL